MQLVWESNTNHQQKGWQKFRMVVDYRALNSKTIPDRFPLPWIDDILDGLGQSAVFTKSNLDSGHQQVSLNSEDAYKAAFLNKQGIYDYTVLPVGFTNAPETL